MGLKLERFWAFGWLMRRSFGLPLKATYLLFDTLVLFPVNCWNRPTLTVLPTTIFTKLILPLSVPALASFAIFQFLWLWNDYLVALVFLGEKNQTVTIAVARLVGKKDKTAPIGTSAAFVSMITAAPGLSSGAALLCAV